MKADSSHPCGSWHSPLSAADVAGASNRISEVRVHGDSVYWLEQLVNENGRTTLVRWRNGQGRQLLPAPFNCRSRVHEYGGGAYALDGEVIYFVNDADQQIYRLAEGETPQALTREPRSRYADLHCAGEFLIAIEEVHGSDDSPPANRLVSIDQRGHVRVLCAQHDFYASPTCCRQSRRLVWLCWDHPAMPWQSTRLMLASLQSDGSIGPPEPVCGGNGVSVFQPQWSDAGELYYVSDSSGWWNLYRRHAGTGDEHALLPMSAEFGLPQWVFAQSMYCLCGDKLIACCNHNGSHRLIELDTRTLQARDIACDDNWFEYLSGNRHGFACLAASPRHSGRVRSYRPAQGFANLTETAIPLAAPYIAEARAMTFRSRHGDDIHANYYPPRHPDHPGDQLPPLIVLCHGGPTAQASPALDIKKQFWTTRGFALLDVNYSGSTGYGRAYQDRLLGQWGVRDVHDVCDAAREAVRLGLAHPGQLIIKGSSAGGYTVLAALTFEDTFHAGASYYGISDLTALTGDTHKFEAHYLDSLIGPWPAQQALYRQRSPINHVERLDCPVIFLQGEEDRVVPKSQAECMVTALEGKRIAVSYLLFSGEQHGFRQRQTLIDALEAELCFYRRIFRLGKPDCALAIRNFP